MPPDPSSAKDSRISWFALHCRFPASCEGEVAAAAAAAASRAVCTSFKSEPPSSKEAAATPGIAMNTALDMRQRFAVARRGNQPTTPVRRFEYRAKKPVFVNEQVRRGGVRVYIARALSPGKTSTQIDP